MKLSSYLTLILVALVAAAPDPLITPKPRLRSRLKLAPRQVDPALLGWVDEFSDIRSCDYPATLSSSGSLVQCCATNSCIFWQSCSADILFAQKTSLRCDQGFCNTAIIVPSVGASKGQSYLGCWATSLGQSPFTIVKNTGSAQAISPSTSGGTSNGPVVAAGPSTAAAAFGNVKPLTGALGVFAAFMGFL